MENTTLQQALSNLNLNCEGQMRENGTLNDGSLTMAYHVRRAIENCFNKGATKRQVSDILNKYQR